VADRSLRELETEAILKKIDLLLRQQSELRGRIENARQQALEARRFRGQPLPAGRSSDTERRRNVERRSGIDRRHPAG
jgi:hypothetical protein